MGERVLEEVDGGVSLTLAVEDAVPLGLFEELDVALGLLEGDGVPVALELGEELEVEDDDDDAEDDAVGEEEGEEDAELVADAVSLPVLEAEEVEVMDVVPVTEGVRLPVPELVPVLLAVRVPLLVPVGVIVSVKEGVSAARRRPPLRGGGSRRTPAAAAAALLACPFVALVVTTAADGVGVTDTVGTTTACPHCEVFAPDVGRHRTTTAVADGARPTTVEKALTVVQLSPPAGAADPSIHSGRGCSTRRRAGEEVLPVNHSRVQLTVGSLPSSVKNVVAPVYADVMVTGREGPPGVDSCRPPGVMVGG